MTMQDEEFDQELPEDCKPCRLGGILEAAEQSCSILGENPIDGYDQRICGRFIEMNELVKTAENDEEIALDEMLNEVNELINESVGPFGRHLREIREMAYAPMPQD